MGLPATSPVPGHGVPAALGASAHEAVESGRKVTWLELFFDLVFVAAISQVGAPLGTEYSLLGLGRFAFLFVLIFWAWHGHATFATRFDHDDVAHRVLMLIQMFAAAVMAVNAKGALDSADSAGFAAAYGVMRIVLVAQYWRVRRQAASERLVRALTGGFCTAAIIWLLSALVPVPARFWLWGLALVIDLATPLAAARFIVHAPPNAHHLPERFGLFTIILLGDAMVGVMRGMESQASWPLDAFLSALMGMTLVFLLWWLYFDVARGAEARDVRTAADVRRHYAWTYAHVPLFVGIAVAGVGLHHTIAVAATGHLHFAESLILSSAVGLAVASLAFVNTAKRHLTFIAAGAAAVAGFAGPVVPCSVLVGALLVAVLVRLAGDRSRTAPHLVPAYDPE